MVDFDLSALADTVWMLALCAMAIRSLRSWEMMAPDAQAPLQWGLDGEPTLFAGRDLAVLFTPTAALVGGLLLAAGERLAGDQAGAGLMLVRFAAPVVLVFAHMAHLKAAVRSVATSPSA